MSLLLAQIVGRTCIAVNINEMHVENSVGEMTYMIQHQPSEPTRQEVGKRDSDESLVVVYYLRLVPFGRGPNKYDDAVKQY